jgi:hypothetical protein
MKRLAIALVSILCAACGCARTVEPVEFLCTYRRSAPALRPESGYRATYAGRSGGYHYLNVRRSTLAQGGLAMLLWGPFQDETLRCRVEDLPEDFPDEFQTVPSESIDAGAGDAQCESREQTLKYVQRYLRRRGRPARQAPTP